MKQGKRTRVHGITISDCGKFCGRGSVSCVHARAYVVTGVPYCKLDKRLLKEDKNNNLYRTPKCVEESNV